MAMLAYNILVSLAVVVLGVLLLGPFALAQGFEIIDPISGTSNPSTVTAVLGKVTSWLQALALPLGAIFIVLAAVKFITSRGNEQKVGEAKKALTYAVIGAFLMILGAGLLCIVTDILGLPSSATGC